MAEDFALRFTRKFECIGGACPATCCSGWSVPVDEPHYRSLERAMSSTASTRARFAETHTVAKKPIPARHALLKILPNGDCAMLDSKRLCETQRSYGEAQLSDTCATYPRKWRLYGARVEHSATLSCPEAARLALKDADAMELEKYDVTRHPRVVLGQRMDKPEPYARYLDEVRGTILALIGHSDISLAARLFLVARLADRTRPLLRRGIEQIDEVALKRELRDALEPATIAALSLAYASLSPSGPRAAFVIVGALKERLDAVGGDAFRTLVRNVLTSYAKNETSDVLEVEPASLMPAYFARRAFWQAQHGARLDAMLTNYCKHYWTTSWYTDSPDLLVHAQKLHLRLALLRFLIIGHPALGQPTGDDALARLEQVTTEIVYTFARAIEHQAEFLEKLDALLERLELLSVAQAVFLLAV